MSEYDDPVELLGRVLAFLERLATDDYWTDQPPFAWNSLDTEKEALEMAQQIRDAVAGIWRERHDEADSE